MPIMKTVEPIAYLKPCPFCGKVPMVRHVMYQRKSSAWDDNWVVECSNKDCDIHPMTSDFYSKDIAVETWNTRCGGTD